MSMEIVQRLKLFAVLAYRNEAISEYTEKQNNSKRLFLNAFLKERPETDCPIPYMFYRHPMWTICGKIS